MSQSWKEIIEFYKDGKTHKGLENLEAIEKLVCYLVNNRDLSSIYPFTSHEVLCLTKFKTYDEWYIKPIISIELNFGANDEYIYKFTLTEPLEDGKIIRYKAEIVHCSFENSLNIFDEFIEKLERLS